MDSVAVLSCTNPECPSENPQPLNAFKIAPSNKRGYTNRCKDCINRLARERYAAAGEVVDRPNLARACNRCGQEKPLVRSNFNLHKNVEHGFDKVCNACKAIKHKSLNYPPIIAPNQIKKCGHCKKGYPQTLEHFAKSRCEKDGLTYDCKNCRNPSDRWKRWNVPEGMKICPSCETLYQLNANNFIRDAKKKNGFSSRCKTCATLARRRSYLNHRAKRIREATDANSQRYAIRRGGKLAGYKVTKADIEKKLEQQKGRCFYCGEKLNGQYHKDHFYPVSKGGEHSLSNIVIACPTCNCSKKGMDPFEFMTWRAMSPTVQKPK